MVSNPAGFYFSFIRLIISLFYTCLIFSAEVKYGECMLSFNCPNNVTSPSSGELQIFLNRLFDRETGSGTKIISFYFSKFWILFYFGSHFIKVVATLYSRIKFTSAFHQVFIQTSNLMSSIVPSTVH